MRAATDVMSRRAPALVVVLAAAGALLTTATGASAAGAVRPLPGIPAPSPASGQDWPSYLHDGTRSAASAETILSPANAAGLRPAANWPYLTGGLIAASATVVGGVVYAGSWDGFEYAINAATGALRWKTLIGTTTQPSCSPANLGVTSAATVVNGTVFVGGGDTRWYALDASTGAVKWSIATVPPGGTAGSYYNWSSPLIYNGYAYIGTASNCDNPLVQGQLIQVELPNDSNALTQGVVTNVARFVPDGKVGGGIWTSPTVDPATNTIFVTTGSIDSTGDASEPMAEAIVALDATTLQVRSVDGGTGNDYWQIPVAEQAIGDADWGTTPTLVSDAAGHQLVSAANKDGLLYTFDRNDLPLGPHGVGWSRQIALGGAGPQAGFGSISSGAFASRLTVTEGPGSANPGSRYTGPVLFFAGGDTSNGGPSFNGSVRAFDPGTGSMLWFHPTGGHVLAALAYENGVLVDGQLQAGTSPAGVEVLDATTGNVKASFLAASTSFYAAPSISHGVIYAGSTDGTLYAFDLGGGPPPTRAGLAAPSTAAAAVRTRAVTQASTVTQALPRAARPSAPRRIATPFPRTLGASDR